MKNETVSVSAANLIVAFIGKYSGKYYAVASRHPVQTDLYQSLSAGPAFHHIGVDELRALGIDVDTLNEKPLGAYSVRHYDGRVPALPVENYSKYACLLAHAAAGEDSFIDWRVMPELRERLTKPYWKGLAPPLTSDDMRHIQVEAGGLVRQPGSAAGQGGKGHKVRIFRPCKLHMPDAILWKILESPAFATLQFGEMTTTKGGRQEGYFERDQRFRLANNVGVNQGPLGLFTLE